MDALTPVETIRLLRQAELDAQKSAVERNRLGQFATPTLLASDILAYARTLLPESSQVRFLDPAIGTGSFYSALLREFPENRVAAATGVEIDPHYEVPSRALWKGTPLRVKCADFTDLNPPRKAEKFNLLICNPPYVRHHHLKSADKERLSRKIESACGVPMGGLAGLYCYFIGIAHAWLADDAVSGWLIPSEFMDVNYGAAVKSYLLDKVELVRIHRFNPNDLQFGDALVSSAIVWFRNRSPAATHDVQMSYGGTLANPSSSRQISTDQLRQTRKWTGLAVNGVQTLHVGIKLGDLFQIKRGLATGKNSFFIMSKQQIKDRGLPMQFFKPILPGPRYLETDIIDADSKGVPKIAHPLFMLDCRLSESEVARLHPTLWKYLQSRKAELADTYLCSRRSPWYAQENRPPAPFVCTYMGRGLDRRAKPFRFILNRSKATAANTYLMLYPKPPMQRALTADAGLALRVWNFLEEIPATTLLCEGRVYGGGLYKMEPRELANVAADDLAQHLSTLNDVATE